MHGFLRFVLLTFMFFVTYNVCFAQETELVDRAFWTPAYWNVNGHAAEIEFGAYEGVAVGDTVWFSVDKVGVNGWGTVELLRQHSAVVQTVNTGIDSTAKFAQVKLPVAKLLANNLLVRVAQAGIELQNYKNQSWNGVAVIQKSSAMDSLLMLMSMAESLKPIAGKIRGTEADSILTQGLFEGKRLSEALEISKAEHIYCFLTFAMSHRQIYEESWYYLGDVYSSWLVQKTPCSVEGLIFLMTDFGHWVELDRLVAKYVDVLEPKLLWQWYDIVNEQIDANPMLAMKHSLILNVIARKLQDERLKALTHYQLGQLYDNAGAFEKAVDNYRETYVYYRKNGQRSADYYGLVCALSLAHGYDKTPWRGDEIIEAAMAEAIASYELQNETVFLKYISDLLLVKSELAMLRNLDYVALHLLLDALNFAAHAGNLTKSEFLQNVYFKLAHLYAELGQKTLAKKYEKLYAATAK